MIPPGKKVVGDKGYQGAPEVISMKKSLDPTELAKFKRCVLAGHESFNSHLKEFQCFRKKF